MNDSIRYTEGSRLRRANFYFRISQKKIKIFALNVEVLKRSKINNVLFFRTATIRSIVLHAKIVAHFVGDSSRDQTDDVRVIHGDTAGEFVGAYRSLEGFTDYATVEGDSPVVEK